MLIQGNQNYGKTTDYSYCILLPRAEIAFISIIM